jgi:hypothetical protein
MHRVSPFPVGFGNRLLITGSKSVSAGAFPWGAHPGLSKYLSLQKCLDVIFVGQGFSVGDHSRAENTKIAELSSLAATVGWRQTHSGSTPK